MGLRSVGRGVGCPRRRMVVGLGGMGVMSGSLLGMGERRDGLGLERGGGGCEIDKRMGGGDPC